MAAENQTKSSLAETWANQLLEQAERGLCRCKVCKQLVDLDPSISMWTQGMIAVSVCARCARSHEIVIRPHERGIDIRVRRVGGLPAIITQ